MSSVAVKNVKSSGLKKQKGVLEHIMLNKSLYILLVPGLIYYLIFYYFPMYGVTMAFKDFDMFSGLFSSEWVGLLHFKNLFTSETFFKVFRNSILISIYKLFFNFPVPIVLAILLNEVKNIYFKKSIQTIVYLPYFLSWVVIAGIVINLLSPSTGVVNTLLKSMGHEPINFLANKSYFRSIIVLSDLWRTMGWNTVIYLAALTGVDPELYESARIDGAGRFHQITRITLPCIRSTIIVLLLLKVGNIMNNGFEQIFMLYNPMVYEVGDVFETYVYRLGLVEARYDFSTAVGLFKSVIAFIMLVGANTLARKFGERGIF
ncbi:MAG: sugar ABC transporter permease [Clostridiaceae bacterium]|jgi:putative aldouronate transport system permease protein|nr:sugar ABC transporter permease [Clostridiaceae bacterium]